MFYVFTWLGDMAAYRLLGLAPDSRLGSATQFFVEDTVKIFVLLAVIIFVMGLFRSALSPEKVRHYLEGRPRGATYVLAVLLGAITPFRSEEHTSELQSLMRISYAVFCLKKK